MSPSLFEQYDAEDPLAHFRDRFVLPEDTIYLNGNSLGAPPKETRNRLLDVFDSQWSSDLSRSWNTHQWFDYPERLGAKIARLIGADAHEVIVADSTSVNLFKLLTTALKMCPGRHEILVLKDDFPTDIYMAEGVAGLLPDVKVCAVESDQLESSINARTAVVLLTHVNYRSGKIHDMPALTRLAHDHGALFLWDLSHSTAALPVSLNACQVDFAVGCGYKFLNGGPGAPAYLYVAERHHDIVSPALSGWIGHASPFDFEGSYRPATGIRRHLCGTHSVLALCGLEAGVDMFLETDMNLVRQKSQLLGDLFIESVEPLCQQYGFEITAPRDREHRGSQVSLRHSEGYAIKKALDARGVIIDFRSPDSLRFGLTPLYTRYIDIRDTIDHLSSIMEHREWDNPQFRQRDTVT